MPEKLKDILFPREKVNQFAEALQQVHPEFNTIGFVNDVCDSDWPDRELKEKMRHTTLCLGKHLPADYGKAIKILLAVVPFVKGFEAIVLPDFAEVYWAQPLGYFAAGFR